MKHIYTFFLSLMFVVFTSQSSFADDKQLSGALIGAGSGALLGQAIGGNTESTLIGAAIGTVFGLAVGSELERDGHVVVHHKHYRPHHKHYRPHNKHYRHYNRHHYTRHPNTGRPFSREYRHHNRDRDREKVCRKIVQYKEHYGRTKKYITHRCWYEDRGFRHNNRFNHRDRYYRYHNHF